MTPSNHNQKPRIGLALGSGAARGLSFIGVLEVFEEENIPIDVIAGTSIGALIGALYASGVSAKKMKEVALNIHWRQLAGLLDPILPKSGLLNGHQVAEFIAELLPARDFTELNIPVAMTATDVESGELVILRQGDILEALRAALAFPGIFTPVRNGDRFLVDGGLCNPVPVDVARSMGADIVIGVSAIPDVDKRPPREAVFPPLPPPEKKTTSKTIPFSSEGVEALFKRIWKKTPETEDVRKPPNIFRIFAQSIVIMENEINALRLEKNHVDLLLRPTLPGLTLLEFHRAAEAIESGAEITRRHLPHLRRLLQ